MNFKKNDINYNRDKSEVTIESASSEFVTVFCIHRKKLKEDELFIKGNPLTSILFYGIERLNQHLSNEEYNVNAREKVLSGYTSTLYFQSLSGRHVAEHELHPYLLPNVIINRCNQDWRANHFYKYRIHVSMYNYSLVFLFGCCLPNWVNNSQTE